LYCFKSQKFWMMKRYKYFYAKKFNRQSDCIVSNPRIFKGKAIQFLLCQKLRIVKAIVSFQTPEFKKIWINEVNASLQTPESFSNEAILLLLFQAIVWVPVFQWGDEGIHRFNLAWNGQ
jgi:hypothetical protein